MDFLFDNPLAAMDGLTFLFCYVLFVIGSLIVYTVLKSRLDRTDRFAVPPIPHNPDAFEIAYLRGGANELVRAVVFALRQKSLLRFENEEKISRICPTNIGYERRSLQPIETAALGWFDANRQPPELFQTGGLADRLKPFAETFRTRLETQHFAPDAEMKRRIRRLALQTFFVFAGLGFYKFAAALYLGFSNVWGIVIATVVGAIILAAAARTPRTTKLGKDYLKRLQLAFDPIKPSNHLPVEAAVAPSATFAAIDPFLLSVGIFGGAALAGTAYSDYNLAFQKAQNQTGGTSGCGSGCGSSSCSSGGDGGGCGGGCGGCS